MDVLGEILKASLERSLHKYSENENEDEFTDYMEAPDIICESPWDNSRTRNKNISPM